MKRLKKILLWVFGSLLIIVFLLLFVVIPILKYQAKKQSPEQHITYTQGDLTLNAFYCSPSKKGRKVFGKLVPYNQVWRTGDNDASTFTTNKDLLINGKTLKKGTYSLWTIPREKNWDVIFNSEMYNWGVSFINNQVARNAKDDVLVVTVPVSKSLTITEKFTISFSEIKNATIMTLAWDNVVVPVLLQEK